MKSIPYLKKYLFWCFFLFAGFNLQAQTTPSTANLIDGFSIELDKDDPLTTTYETNVAHYAEYMQTPEEAVGFIIQFEKEWVTCSLDYAQMKVTITLEMNNETADWNIDDWNHYLKPENEE